MNPGRESGCVASVGAWVQNNLFVAAVMLETVTMQDASSRVGLIADVPPLQDPHQTSSGSGRRGWHIAWFLTLSYASPWPLGCCGGFLSFRYVLNGILLD